MSFTLSATEFDVVWCGQGHGRPPTVLDMPSPGATHAERARIEHDVWAALAKDGLADRFGEPARHLLDAVEIIAGRVTSLELHTSGFRALLGRLNRRAVLVRFEGDELRFHPVADTGLAHTLVDLLPALPAGIGQSITVDATVLAKVEGAGTVNERRAILQDSGVTRASARTLLDMISDAAGHGQIVGESVHRGERTRTDVVAFFHNQTGRYRVLRRGDHLTITPTTLPQLAGAVEALIS